MKVKIPSNVKHLDIKTKEVADMWKEKQQIESLVLTPVLNEILKRCNTEYETKIQEALLIKKSKPKLNSQLYANGCSFLLNIF